MSHRELIDIAHRKQGAVLFAFDEDGEDPLRKAAAMEAPGRRGRGRRRRTPADASDLKGLPCD